MGPTRTLPPDQRAAPRTPPQRVNDPLEFDQPPTTPPTPTAEPQRLRDRGIPLHGTTEQLHRAVDLLEADTLAYTYYAKVIASRQRDQIPLGRRSPEPLEAARQGVER